MVLQILLSVGVAEAFLRPLEPAIWEWLAIWAAPRQEQALGVSDNDVK